ncbi:HAD family hydrolase [Gracilibacillus alcaliphilus]|uniref:HAD family hydrolase n=1 Tax=Gracilibacillus alcaliphilus TaxID=1401441 RepID=UPI001959D2AA|nr:HAD family hydrolase [Gracilibacillus alcaliphilus]MBM7679618.1 putative hydrolase of the HAD superfamily [Gracilibacillus alcaliphilus]
MKETSKQKKIIVFLDCGDTIIDESTEIRDQDDIVVKAELIPGAGDMVRILAEKGYRLCMVADGNAQSFKNMMLDHQLYDYFEAMIYSENIKELKPSPRMFKAAMGALELTESDISRIVMVGNNLSRDIAGANRMELTSIHLDWTSRYPKTPKNKEETPDYTIHQPSELIPLVDRLNEQLI